MYELVVPSLTGGGLVNLVAELERRLTGTSPSPGLAPAAASAIPMADSYVLVLFDGLGAHQLTHPKAGSLRKDLADKLHAPFPTMTTVSLATIATGLPAAAHGVLGYFQWIPELGQVLNTLKWITPFGVPVEIETRDRLPGPNLWERLRAGGIEPITVQPGHFLNTPMTRLLYRGCRFEPIWTMDELLTATLQLAAEPGRLVFTYLADVDFAAHLFGQRSLEYSDAIGRVASIWDRLGLGLPPSAAMVGTADHGHLDYREEDKILIRDPAFDDLVFFGDPRSLLVKGNMSSIRRLTTEVGGELRTLAEARSWWGDGLPHPDFEELAPDAVILAPERKVLLPRGFDKRLTGYHGGLDRREVEIPLLVAARP